MTLLYLDTNVFLARYNRAEEAHPEALRLLRRVESGEASAAASVLTMIEIACAAARADWSRTPEERRGAVDALLRRLLATKNLTVLTLGGTVNLDAMRASLEVPRAVALSLDSAHLTGLKTLDQIHLATASMSQRLVGRKVDAFVTLDEDILGRRDEITATYGFPAVKPGDAA